MKWNEMKWNEMKWNEMKWYEIKWNEEKRDRIEEKKRRWREVRGEERVNYLFSYSLSTPLFFSRILSVSFISCQIAQIF